MTQTMDAQLAKYELEIEIAAPRNRVWEALTEETDAWWLAEFRMVDSHSVVSFEPRAGGALLESKADGGSLLWYTVHMVSPGDSIHLVGHSAADFGGPAVTMLKLAIEERADGCALVVSDSLIGNVSDEFCRSLESGWRQLFTDGLKQFVESER